MLYMGALYGHCLFSHISLETRRVLEKIDKLSLF